MASRLTFMVFVFTPFSYPVCMLSQSESGT